MNPALEPCTHLAWDSTFFGVAVARVNGATLDDACAAEIDAWCARQRTACLFFLAGADDVATARCAARHGYDLIEVRMEYEWPGGEGAGGAMPADVRPALPVDVPALEAIAGASFTDSRYYLDGRFPRAKCDELYACWVRQSCRPGGLADTTLVVERDGVPAAFITCKREAAAIGRIGLVGVDARFRGQGLGRQIVGAAQSWFSAQGLSRARVVTQGRNIVSQRLYQRCGFLTHAVGLYYHKWFP
jgi:GNAT superfamily N-acetyltransferase